MTTTLTRPRGSVLTDDPRNSTFAQYVEELAASRASRELSRLTRENGAYVNPTTIADMRWGVVPSYKILDRFAEGLRLSGSQKAELFRRAGYASTVTGLPPSERPRDNYWRRFGAIRDRLLELGGHEVQPTNAHEGTGSYTQEDADQAIALVIEGIEADYPHLKGKFDDF